MCIFIEVAASATRDKGIVAKGLIIELALSYAQNAWGSKGKRVQAAELAACYNYFSKKKKKKKIEA